MRKSSARVVASGSVRKTRSTLTQRPTVVRHCSCAPSERTFQAVGVSLYCAIRAQARPLGPRGDQVPEPQPHLGAVADRAVGEAVDTGCPARAPPGAGCRGPRRSGGCRGGPRAARARRTSAAPGTARGPSARRRAPSRRPGGARPRGGRAAGRSRRRGSAGAPAGAGPGPSRPARRSGSAAARPRARAVDDADADALADRLGGGLGLVARPDLEHGPLAAPLRLVGRGDHLRACPTGPTAPRRPATTAAAPRGWPPASSTPTPRPSPRPPPARRPRRPRRRSGGGNRSASPPGPARPSGSRSSGVPGPGRSRTRARRRPRSGAPGRPRAGGAGEDRRAQGHRRRPSLEKRMARRRAGRGGSAQGLGRAISVGANHRPCAAATTRRRPAPGRACGARGLGLIETSPISS